MKLTSGMSFLVIAVLKMMIRGQEDHKEGMFKLGTPYSTGSGAWQSQWIVELVVRLGSVDPGAHTILKFKLNI